MKTNKEKKHPKELKRMLRRFKHGALYLNSTKGKYIRTMWGADRIDLYAMWK